MSECPRCLMTDDIIGVKIGKNQCNFCDLHDSLEKEYPVSVLKESELVARIRKRGKNKKYDCLLGISGGSDSSYLMYWAYCHDLNVLTFHFDNGFNHDLAERNMKRMLESTGFDHVRIRINPKEYNALNYAFLKASVSDCDIPNDIAMGALMIELAVKYDIKTILNGHNFRTEGSVPIGWTYMDSGYIEDVYRKAIDEGLYSYPKLTIWDQIKASLKGIHHERPFYHMAGDKQKNRIMLTEEFGWETYEGWHCENKYTQFAGWVAYKKFGIDKRLIELSAKIRTGVINKKTAKLILEETIQEPIEVVDEIRKKLKITEEYEDIMAKPRRMFFEFNTYHKKFIRFRWLIWIGYKLHFLPKTFYTKYTKKI